MENIRFGTLATEMARPNCKAWSLPKPGDWFKPPKGPVGQSEEEMKGVVELAAKRFEAHRNRSA